VSLDRVTLIGVGLLGGSLGLALQQRGLARRVVGHVRREESVTACRALGVVHEATTDLAEAVRGSDLVVLCTPLGQMETLARQFAPHLKPGALVTDVGSVKAPVVASLEPLLRVAGAVFVGGHPMAGSEKAGPEHARADLFQGAQCLVTPTPSTDATSLRAVEDLWRGVGGVPLRMTPELHDQLVARTSHLPHLVAAALVHLVLDPAAPPEQARVCASGFRDTTRVASGSPEMWRDIASTNSQQLTTALDDLITRLHGARAALAGGDTSALATFFEAAKRRRDQWLSAAANGKSPE